MQQLEDYLVENTDKQFNSEDIVEVYKEIHERLENIYKVISNGYLGKKFKKRKNH